MTRVPRGPRRALLFVGIVALLFGLALLVARPRAPDPATVPYLGLHGGSRAHEAGLAIYYQRDGVERAVDPSSVLRAGDVLRLVARVERPRQIEVRVADAGPPVVVFPATGDVTALASPGQTLPVSPQLGPTAGRVTVVALFSDQVRALGAPPDSDTEVVQVAIAKQLAGPSP